MSTKQGLPLLVALSILITGSILLTSCANTEPNSGRPEPFGSKYIAYQDSLAAIKAKVESEKLAHEAWVTEIAETKKKAKADSIAQVNLELEANKQETRVASGSLNIRSGRSTSYPVVAGLSPGQSVSVNRLVDGWYRVHLNGKHIGYASAKYLVEPSDYIPKPKPKPTPRVEKNSQPTGMFGIPLPRGSILTDYTSETANNDAAEYYDVNSSASSIRSFFRSEFSKAGWDSYMADTSSMISYKKGNRVIAVIISSSGNSFALMGGRR
jgi:hypothetical protein